MKVVWWLSSLRMTVRVVTERKLGGINVIVEAAPIIRKFIGQPMTNLLIWMNPDRVEVLEAEEIVGPSRPTPA